MPWTVVQPFYAHLLQASISCHQRFYRGHLARREEIRQSYDGWTPVEHLHFNELEGRMENILVVVAVEPGTGRSVDRGEFWVEAHFEDVWLPSVADVVVAQYLLHFRRNIIAFASGKEHHREEWEE